MNEKKEMRKRGSFIELASASISLVIIVLFLDGITRIIGIASLGGLWFAHLVMKYKNEGVRNEIRWRNCRGNI